jgi:hypothetical protein
MSFEDLPSDWPDIPLAAPTHIADVLDLFVSMQTRLDGALLVLVCDSLRRPVQPILLHGSTRCRSPMPTACCPPGPTRSPGRHPVARWCSRWHAGAG